MAPTSLLFLATLISFSHRSDAQTIIDSSASFSSLDLPRDFPPPPTKQTFRFWPSLPPRGRSDVPIRVTVTEQFISQNSVEQGQRMARPTPQLSSSFITSLSVQNLSRGPTQSPASRPRTDTASLAFSKATKRPTRPLPTLPSAVVAEPADPDDASDTKTEDRYSQGLGSGKDPAETYEKKNFHPRPTAGELAQYWPQAQTMRTDATYKKHQPLDDQPELVVLTPTSTANTVSKTTSSAAVIQQTTQTEKLTGKLEVNISKKDSDTLTSSQPPENSSKSADAQAGGPAVTTKRQMTANPQVTQTTTTGLPSTTQEASQTSSKTTQAGKDAASTTVPWKRAGAPPVPTSAGVPVVRSRFSPTYQAGIGRQNRSLLLEHPQQAPHSTFNPASSSSVNRSPNATLLYWGDLSRTLAFAWELHVYGTASLFLLLFAGAALGLMLSPNTNCPHRGALALANALLFIASGLRAALFFIDPYGTKKFLPRPAVTALYNLPLHLLVWAQAALALLALRVASVSVLPSTLERPPLVAVLAVLQSTLLLAADLLSPALSPLVPVTLQTLSLCWGLSVCLGFLCYVFPRIRCPSIPHPGVPEELRRKTWMGSWKIGIILGRVLAVCAVLGALCCGLHVHATLWLYGLLGDWTRFNWGWWLVHFWARLLELAWGFSLLLLASWVFWRPAEYVRREEGGQDCRTTGDLPSPGQSVSSSQRHTCWSKIVQSLRGKPCRKSDSNGLGGAGGGTGEVPNNWAGQERPGADISKSLIRNQNHEQNTTQSRSVKDSNHGRNHRGHSAERGMFHGSVGSLLRLQAFGQLPQRTVSGSLDQDRDTSLSFCEFDLRPPSPIDLTRSIDEALHREHLLVGGSLFHPFDQVSLSPSPGSGVSQGPWLRRNSDPQLLSDSSEAPTESSMPLGGSVLSSVPSRQVTAPPTPSHQGHRWAGNGALNVPSSVSCPVSLHPSRTSTGHLGDDGVDDTRPFITPDSDRVRGRPARPAGSRSYLEVSRRDDSASVSSEIIDL